MPRPISKVAPGWWDYTTLDGSILEDAAKLTDDDLLQLSRDGFKVRIYDTLQEFYCAEAMEYIEAWRQATPDNPAGTCGPIGPTEQLPLVAQMEMRNLQRSSPCSTMVPASASITEPPPRSSHCPALHFGCDSA